MSKKTLRYTRPLLHSVSGPGTCACVSGSAAGASGFTCSVGPTVGVQCSAGAGAVDAGRSACVSGNNAVGGLFACDSNGAGAAGPAGATPCRSAGNTPVTRTGGNACLVGGGG